MINNLLDFTDIFNQIRIDERQNIINLIDSQELWEIDELKKAILAIDELKKAINQIPEGDTNEPATD